MGGHVFLEYMSFMMTCIKGAHVLRRSYSVGGNLLSACLQDGISYSTICFTGRHILQEKMSYLRLCLIEGHVLQVEISQKI